MVRRVSEPFNKREISENVDQTALKIHYLNNHRSVRLVTKDGMTDKTFNFDHVFEPTTKQSDFFDITGQPVMDAGKTWSMMGPTDENKKLKDLRGIIPRSGEAIFDYINKSEGNFEYKVSVQYLEIYRDDVQDLLDPSRTHLSIHESPTKGIYVKNLSEVYISNLHDVYYYLQLGDHNKVMACTDMNKSSSRSHAVYTLKMIQTDRVTGKTITGKVNLVDLAGSEKVRKTGAVGVRLKEAQEINKSLSALGMCINSIAENKPYIPYRNSKLTRILQESLGGNSKTTIVCACSPHPFNLDETVSTLGFGKRAKSIKLKVKANVQRSSEELEKLVESLERQLAKEKVKNKKLMKELSKFRELSPEEQEELKKLEEVKAPKKGGDHHIDEEGHDHEDLSLSALQFELKSLKCKYDNEVTSVKEEAKKERKLRDDIEEEMKGVKVHAKELEEENKTLKLQEDKYDKIKKDFVTKLKYEKQQFMAERKLLEKENDSLTKKLEDMEEKTLKMEDDLAAAQGKTISDPKERAKYLSQIDSLRRNFQDIKEENDVLMDQLEQIETSTSKTTSQLIHLKHEHDDTVKEVDRLKGIKKEYEEKLFTFDRDIQETEEELETLMQENEVFEQETRRMEEENHRLLDKVRGKNVLLTKMKMLMKKYHINLAELQKVKLQMPVNKAGHQCKESGDDKSGHVNHAIWEHDDSELSQYEHHTKMELKSIPQTGEGLSHSIDHHSETSVVEHLLEESAGGESSEFVSKLRHELGEVHKKEVEVSRHLKEVSAKFDKLKEDFDGQKATNKKQQGTMNELKAEREAALREKEDVVAKSREEVRTLEKDVAVLREENKVLTEKVDMKSKSFKEYKAKVDKRVKQLEEEHEKFLIEKEKFIDRTVSSEKKKKKAGGNIKNLVNELFELRLKHKSSSSERERLLRECNYQRRQMNSDRKKLRIAEERGGLREKRIFALEKDLKAERYAREKMAEELQELKRSDEKMRKKLCDVEEKLAAAKEFQNLNRLTSSIKEKRGFVPSNVYRPIGPQPVIRTHAVDHSTRISWFDE